MTTFTLKSGTNKGNRRIWIEGNRLAELGLTRGTTLTRVMYDDGYMVLTTESGIKGRRHSIAGTAERPILDLCGKWVTAFMGDHTHFEVHQINGRLHGPYLDLVITPINA